MAEFCKKLGSGLCLLSFLNLIGCAGIGISLRDKLPQSATLVASEEGFMQLLNERENELNSFRGLARVTVTANEEKTTIRQVVAYERPNFLRVESIPLNSAYAFSILVADGRNLNFLDTSEKISLSGQDSAATLQRLVDIPLETKALLAVLAGRVPLSRLASMEEVEQFLDAQTGSVYILNEESGELFVIDRVSGLLKEAWFRDRFSAKLRAKLEFLQYSSKDGIEIPVQFRLIIPNKETEMEYKFATFTINKPLPRAVFTVQIPADYSRREL